VSLIDFERKTKSKVIFIMTGLLLISLIGLVNRPAPEHVNKGDGVLLPYQFGDRLRFRLAGSPVAGLDVVVYYHVPEELAYNSPCLGGTYYVRVGTPELNFNVSACGEDLEDPTVTKE
jgi:hypothetical protein